MTAPPGFLLVEVRGWSGTLFDALDAGRLTPEEREALSRPTLLEQARTAETAMLRRAEATAKAKRAARDRGQMGGAA